MSLSDISVKIKEQPTGMAYAVLHELATNLEQLLDTAEENTIDLRSLPMNEADREELAELLGRGEVDITLNTIGSSRIFETAFSGIWWVTHYGDDAMVLSELIEVAKVPSLIPTHTDEISVALQRIQQVSTQAMMESKDV